MLKSLQPWVRLPSFPHESNKVSGGNLSPPSAAQMGDGEPSSRQQRDLQAWSAVASPVGLRVGCLQLKIHPGGERQELRSCSLDCARLLESVKAAGDTWGKPSEGNCLFLLLDASGQGGAGH